MREGTSKPVGVGRGMDIMRARRRQFPVAGGRLVLCVLAVAFFASLISCSRSGDSVAGNTTKVTDADNEHAVLLTTGDTLVVALASTPGTGFGWKIADLDSKMLREIGTPEVIPGSHPMPGAPATQVFHFQAIGGGSTGLELDYVRPWEKGAAPARSFKLGVTVR